MKKEKRIEIVICDSIKKNTNSIFASLIDFKYELHEDDFIQINISNLNDNESLQLKKSINNEIKHLDIDMFFIEDIDYPIFGNDFKYEIKDEQLIGNSHKKKN